VVPERVLLARHGKTAWNAEGRLQGQLDSPLLEEGQEHARQLADLARRRGVDAVFCSPLGRARTTAEVCAGTLDLDVTVIDELAEVHHGQMAGMTESEIRERFPGQREDRHDDKYAWRFPDGESYADADDRAAAALERIFHGHRSRRPLIVSHEMIGRMLVRNLLNLSPDEALARSQPHDTVFEITMKARTLTALRTSARRPAAPR